MPLSTAHEHQGGSLVSPAGGDADAPAIKALAVHALSLLSTARTVVIPPFSAAAGASNPPFYDWPERYQGRFHLSAFELMEDVLHFDAVLPPFWPIGNADCPMYRVSSPFRTLEASEAVHDDVTAAWGVLVSSGDDDIARVFRRLGDLPLETALFWKGESDRLSDRLKQRQQASLAAHTTLAAALDNDFVARSLEERLLHVFSSERMGLITDVPPKADAIIRQFVEQYGCQPVADILRVRPLPVRAETWTAMLALVDSLR